MNLFETYRNHVLDALERVAPGFNTAAVTLEPPRDASHGDLSTNAAMVVGGQAKMKPRELADKLAEQLRALPDVTEVSVAGPGFINMRLAPSVWQGMVGTILVHGVGFGNSTIGANKRVNVEYVSANPTGPLHIGHARGAVYGDALATLLMKAGYNVTREYYINDAGAQIEVLARSALLRYRETLGETITIPEGLYPGDYLRGVGDALKAKFGDALLKKPESAQIADAKAIAIDCMMALIKQDLFDLGIVHDVFTSEAALRDSGAIERAIEQLQAAGHLYQGTLEPPKGETPDDWEAKEQLLFRATAFGDDMDRTVQKSDGNYAYFAGDLALTMDKLRRHFEVLIYMLGADHGGYVKRLKAIAGAFSNNTVEADVLLCQLVRLTKNGEPVKMSKRAGTFVTVRDVLDEVGRDILRFVMLMRKSSQDMDFDLAKVKEQSKDNPVFYVHYAHARAKSLLRMGREQVAEAFENSQAPTAALLALLTHPAELALIRLLASWPRQVEQAALAHEPHRVIYYLQEVAASFHGLWNEADLRFIQPQMPELTAARLALARAMAVVLASGLAVCGVEPVEELRG
ncbi:MAG: arginine--tRNA ligase [Rickettsiales bacterium]